MTYIRVDKHNPAMNFVERDVLKRTASQNSEKVIFEGKTYVNRVTDGVLWTNSNAVLKQNDTKARQYTTVVKHTNQDKIRLLFHQVIV